MIWSHRVATPVGLAVGGGVGGGVIGLAVGIGVGGGLTGASVGGGFTGAVSSFFSSAGVGAGIITTLYPPALPRQSLSLPDAHWHSPTLAREAMVEPQSESTCVDPTPRSESLRKVKRGHKNTHSTTIKN